jgi:hypothetical protein
MFIDLLLVIGIFSIDIFREKSFFALNCNQKYSLYTIENPLDGKNSL